jgi:L-ascorbate metabolism protein UlaG (beta-lactamase superfamily)
MSQITMSQITGSQITKITFCGHSAVLCHIQGDTSNKDAALIAIDPWLEGNPLCPAELKQPEGLKLIVLTHGHSDHAGDVIRLAKSTGAKVAATYELSSLLAEDGVPGDQLIFLNKGGTLHFMGLEITLVHALHSNSYQMSDGRVCYAGEACGVVIRDQSSCLYHAGDTDLFGDMQLIRDLYRPNIALLPVGDTFTMGVTQAVRAAKLVSAEITIPIHHSTFPQLLGSPTQFIEQLSEVSLKGQILQPGESLSVK